jgi:hypothetical protein
MPELETYKKIALLPDELKKEVDDFIDFLLTKKNNRPKKRKPGLAKGLIKMKDGFDEPLKDFNDYMFE